ncbi:unnamed protein product [Lactuca saligna]|uniref:FAD-binding PCMH-type domain-containing protein n=1 Tax=Lactuca saligna TaxID=75948 RepID=A0AA35YJX0_LACSI|nr:unnamed protein product [Lactuca saligna]
MPVTVTTMMMVVVVVVVMVMVIIAMMLMMMVVVVVVVVVVMVMVMVMVMMVLVGDGDGGGGDDSDGDDEDNNDMEDGSGGGGGSDNDDDGDGDGDDGSSGDGDGDDDGDGDGCGDNGDSGGDGGDEYEDDDEDGGGGGSDDDDGDGNGDGDGDDDGDGDGCGDNGDSDGDGGDEDEDDDEDGGGRGSDDDSDDDDGDGNGDGDGDDGGDDGGGNGDGDDDCDGDGGGDDGDGDDDDEDDDNDDDDDEDDDSGGGDGDDGDGDYDDDGGGGGFDDDDDDDDNDDDDDEDDGNGDDDDDDDDDDSGGGGDDDDDSGGVGDDDSGGGDDGGGGVGDGGDGDDGDDDVDDGGDCGGDDDGDDDDDHHHHHHHHDVAQCSLRSLYINTLLPWIKLTKLNMKKSQLSASVFLFVLILSFSVSWATFSSLVDGTPWPDSGKLISCVHSNSNNVTTISQLIFTPVNASFLPIWQAHVQNIKFLKPSTRKPSVIVTPVEETLIQTTLYCAKKHGYEIRIRSGGHDFEALSYSADVPFVMIDFTKMRSVDVDVINRSAWAQTGAVLGDLYYSISQKTDTLYFPGGVCPTVGLGGYLSGGGYGNLIRKYGTAADNILDFRVIDVNGNILDRKSMGEDLFWAIRGGGASSFGIVLAWKLRLVPVPEIVTVFILNKTLEQRATEIFHKYQYVAPTIDRNLHIRTQVFGEYIRNTTKKTIRIMFEGIYQGTKDTLLPLLDENFPELGVTREICEEIKSIQSTLVFWGLPSSTPIEILTNRSAIDKLNNKVKSDYVRTPIPISGLRKIWRKFFENDESALLMINPFGGKMADFVETETPYPHRAGVLYQVLETVNFFGQTSDMTPTSLQRIAWLRSLEKLLTPYVSKNPREAYANYVDLDFGVGNSNYEEASVWGERYWKRDNFKKLIGIKAKIDPENFFRHPQSIPVFSTSLSDM